VTANPAIGFAVGVGVSASADFLGSYIERVRTGAEQDVIAETARALPAGGEAHWTIRYTIPIGNEQASCELSMSLRRRSRSARRSSFR
jgi:hypothetical protein